jgi:TetR/AcrR family hemagglutinin/protease transcriptional regulator
VEAIRRRARRLPPADRREQLLDRAVTVFAARGIGRAAHADVARAAAVSVPTVFAYFRTRSALVRAVLDRVAHYFDQIADRFHPPTYTAPRALLGHAVAFATSVDSDPDYARVLLEWSTAIRDDVWPLFLRFQEGMLNRCRQTIEHGQREGTISADVDPESAALMIIGSGWMVIQMSFTHWPPERIHRFLLAQLRGAIGADAVAQSLV